MLARNASARLRRALEDEIDWIVLRALERIPARRYTTPDELADDLERWLTGGNVRARPATALYRLRKMAQRHRAAIIGTGALVAALTVAVAGLTYGVIESSRQAAAPRASAVIISATHCRLSGPVVTSLEHEASAVTIPSLIRASGASGGGSTLSSFSSPCSPGGGASMSLSQGWSESRSRLMLRR